MIQMTAMGAVGDRDIEGLAGEVFADVRSERGLCGQIYMGYTPIWESVFPTRARPRIDGHRCNVFEAGGEIGYQLVIDNYTSRSVEATCDLSP